MNFAITMYLVIIFCTIVFGPINGDWWDDDEDKSKIWHANESAFIGDHPYTVSIVIVANKREPEDTFLCGGTIIGERQSQGKFFGIVLTAGSCIYNLNKGGFQTGDVRVRGNSEYWSYCTCGIAEEYEIHKWRLHPGYSEEANADHVVEDISFSDIGIIATIGRWRGCYDKAATAKLVLTGINQLSTNDYQYTTVGWGLWGVGGKVLPDLRVVANLQEVPLKECKQLYYNRPNFPEDVFCITAGPCRYDQGSPVVIVHGGTTYLAGIVSSTPRCKTNYPTPYPPLIIKYNMHIEFIKNFTDKNLNEEESTPSLTGAVRDWEIFY